MRMKTCLIAIYLPLSLLIGVTQAEPMINSREYKILLEPAQFIGDTAQVTIKLNDFLTNLDEEMKKQNVTATIDGKFIENKVRNISFYDTPDTCKLKAENYVARERTQLGNNKREVMIKRRTNTLAELDGIALAGSSADASSKVEADIISGNIVYSTSTKQTIDNEPLDSIASLYKFFPSLEQYFNQSGALAKVGNLTVSDHAFGGPKVTLNDQVFEFDVSVWYVNDMVTPVIVEISYKITESNGNFSSISLKNADQIMNLIVGMGQWTAPQSVMKTSWVYQYQPDFCK